MNTDPAVLAKVLKPCPFCGFQVDEHSFGKPGERWEVFCRACDSAGRPSDTMEQAIAAWNRRPANTMTPEEVRVPLDLFKRTTHPAASDRKTVVSGKGGSVSVEI